MPLDHFVPQVYLRGFYSPALSNRMYALRKSDLKAFTPTSESVCRIMDGSTNAYLSRERAIEDFLKTIEPRYNAALVQLAANQPAHDTVYTIAGLVAYILTCSPAAMRINVEPFKGSIEATAKALDAHGLLPPPPDVLGGTTVTSLLDSGAINVDVDPKYPQAIGITLIVQHIARFGNSLWEILHNDFDDSPFFTSDFPVAIEPTSDPRTLNRLFPLAPHLAIRIRPIVTLDESQYTLDFGSLSCRHRTLSRREVVRLNRLFVQCAEDMVFYRDDRPWIRSLVEKNRFFRIETRSQSLLIGSRQFIFSTQQIVAGPTQREPNH